MPRRGLGVDLLLAGVSVALALGVAEGVLRAAGYHYSPVHIDVRREGDWRDEHAFNDSAFTYDPVLIWRPIGGAFSSYNPQGFRGLPLDEAKTPGTRRVFAIGDSNTFGWEHDDGANWPEQLDGLVRSAHPDTSVINAGVWGYSSLQGLRRFKEVLAFQPDVVLVSFGANDAHQVFVSDAGYVDSYVRGQRLQRLTSHLRVGQVVVAAWDRVAQIGRADTARVARVSVDEYRANLAEIIALARARGATPVLLTRPYVGTETDPAIWKTHAPDYYRATRELGAREGVLVVDVYEAFRDRTEFFDDESHFNAAGHRRAAEIIAQAIDPVLR